MDTYNPDLHINTSAAELERQIIREVDGASPDPKNLSSLKKYLANDKTPLEELTIGHQNKKLMNDSDIAELWNKQSDLKGPNQSVQK